MRSAAQVSESVPRLIEWERPVDDGMDFVLREKGIQRLEIRSRADVDAVEPGVARREREEACVRRSEAREHADERDLPAGGDAVHRLSERARTADLDDVIDSALVREPPDFLVPIG